MTLGVLATLRAAGVESPVLILSALSGVDERVRGLRAGGDDYLTKPFDSLELTARLEVLLRRGSMQSRGEFTLRQGLDRRHSPGGSRERVGGMTPPTCRQERRHARRGRVARFIYSSASAVS